jgi:hypothetical protein
MSAKTQKISIYLDRGSIHAEMLRRHPEMDEAIVGLNNTTSREWATCIDITGTHDGPADIAWAEAYDEDYYGFTIRMLRLRNVSDDYWSSRDAILKGEGG